MSAVKHAIVTRPSVSDLSEDGEAPDTSTGETVQQSAGVHAATARAQPPGTATPAPSAIAPAVTTVPSLKAPSPALNGSERRRIAHSSEHPATPTHSLDHSALQAIAALYSGSLARGSAGASDSAGQQQLPRFPSVDILSATTHQYEAQHAHQGDAGDEDDDDEDAEADFYASLDRASKAKSASSSSSSTQLQAASDTTRHASKLTSRLSGSSVGPFSNTNRGSGGHTIAGTIVRKVQPSTAAASSSSTVAGAAAAAAGSSVLHSASSSAPQRQQPEQKQQLPRRSSAPQASKWLMVEEDVRRSKANELRKKAQDLTSGIEFTRNREKKILEYMEEAARLEREAEESDADKDDTELGSSRGEDAAMDDDADDAATYDVTMDLGEGHSAGAAAAASRASSTAKPAASSSGKSNADAAAQAIRRVQQPEISSQRHIASSQLQSASATAGASVLERKPTGHDSRASSPSNASSSSDRRQSRSSTDDTERRRPHHHTGTGEHADAKPQGHKTKKRKSNRNTHAGDWEYQEVDERRLLAQEKKKQAQEYLILGTNAGIVKALQLQEQASLLEAAAAASDDHADDESGSEDDSNSGCASDASGDDGRAAAPKSAAVANAERTASRVSASGATAVGAVPTSRFAAAVKAAQSASNAESNSSTAAPAKHSGAVGASNATVATKIQQSQQQRQPQLQDGTKREENRKRLRMDDPDAWIYRTIDQRRFDAKALQLQAQELRVRGTKMGRDRAEEIEAKARQLIAEADASDAEDNDSDTFAAGGSTAEQQRGRTAGSEFAVSVAASSSTATAAVAAAQPATMVRKTAVASDYPQLTAAEAPHRVDDNYKCPHAGCDYATKVKARLPKHCLPHGLLITVGGVVQLDDDAIKRHLGAAPAIRYPAGTSVPVPKYNGQVEGYCCPVPSCNYSSKDKPRIIAHCLNVHGLMVKADAEAAGGAGTPATAAAALSVSRAGNFTSKAAAATGADAPTPAVNNVAPSPQNLKLVSSLATLKAGKDAALDSSFTPTAVHIRPSLDLPLACSTAAGAGAGAGASAALHHEQAAVTTPGRVSAPRSLVEQQWPAGLGSATAGAGPALPSVDSSSAAGSLSDLMIQTGRPTRVATRIMQLVEAACDAITSATLASSPGSPGPTHHATSNFIVASSSSSFTVGQGWSSSAVSSAEVRRSTLEALQSAEDVLLSCTGIAAELQDQPSELLQPVIAEASAAAALGLGSASSSSSSSATAMDTENDDEKQPLRQLLIELRVGLRSALAAVESALKPAFQAAAAASGGQPASGANQSSNLEASTSSGLSKLSAYAAAPLSSMHLQLLKAACALVTALGCAGAPECGVTAPQPSSSIEAQSLSLVVHLARAGATTPSAEGYLPLAYAAMVAGRSNLSLQLCVQLLDDLCRGLRASMTSQQQQASPGTPMSFSSGHPASVAGSPPANAMRASVGAAALQGTAFAGDALGTAGAAGAGFGGWSAGTGAASLSRQSSNASSIGQPLGSSADGGTGGSRWIEDAVIQTASLVHSIEAAVRDRAAAAGGTGFSQLSSLLCSAAMTALTTLTAIQASISSSDSASASKRVCEDTCQACVRRLSIAIAISRDGNPPSGSSAAGSSTPAAAAALASISGLSAPPATSSALILSKAVRDAWEPACKALRAGSLIWPPSSSAPSTTTGSNSAGALAIAPASALPTPKSFLLELSKKLQTAKTMAAASEGVNMQM